jgi:hypothetical protein
MIRDVHPGSGFLFHPASGSGFFPIPNPGVKKAQKAPDPGYGRVKKSRSGSGMNIPDYISKILKTIFWVKNT